MPPEPLPAFAAMHQADPSIPLLNLEAAYDDVLEVYDVQDKERENRPLQTAPDLDAAAWSDDFERAQDLELHRRNRRIQSHQSPAVSGR